MATRGVGSSASCSIKTILSPIAVLRDAGHSVAPVLEAAGICEQDLLDPDHRISTACMLLAWELGEEISGDPAFGLRAAEALDPDTTALFAYLAAASDTPRDAFKRASRYLRIIGETLEYNLEARAPYTVCTFRMRDVDVMPRSHIDYVVAMMARIAGQIVPDTDVVEAWFAYPAPSYASTYAEVIPLEICFDASASGLGGRFGSLDTPLPGADATLRNLLEVQAQQALAKLPRRESFGDDVRNAITRGLSRGATGAEAIAEALAMSPRTLRRRLEEAGLTHRQLVDEVRSEVAKQALSDAVPINEVAYRVGFSDASAFHKAFRRWTGTSPGAYVEGLESSS